ncbi:uracil-DNA glycosylase [Agathobaculum sp. NTUH-O15-33]|uniref:uracil-DNA glycosylase n=1 Tax=Agathobaculum sp. NTUH-O15-33 TaxID=3079302 RepID=UPI0029588A6B|nr:uracil-DNA glycosylase [Agathobaculum sp. NTUH-O15-33]WNX86421.1 uracil-DNA glycosylase [Agathobaculum sp. NTUH-O15-33]
MVHIGNEWDDLLADEFEQEYYKKIRYFLKKEYAEQTIFPPMSDIFNALRYTSFSDVKAVLLGQDPYHGPGQAHGLCFSVKEGVQPPPSLQNIFKELHDDLGFDAPPNGTLTKWAKQGVLLLNTVLTVRQGFANSHKNLGWTTFTDHVIQRLNEREKPVVFLLWGAGARSKKPLITAPQHLILECAHPSPLSAFNGFFGCKHFSKCNAFLEQNGMEPIDWNLNTP